MARHNLGTVVHFEFTRTVKKRRFWIATLAIPILLAIVFGLVFASNSSTKSQADAQKHDKISFTYTDSSALVDPALAKAMGGTVEADPGTAVERVKAGTLNAYFSYPASPAKETVNVYGADQGIFKNGTYDAVAKQLLVLSAQEKVGSAELAAAVQGNFRSDTQTYKDGQLSGGLETVVPPLLFLVLFYVVIILLANQMLASTLEEKENRVTEMILTTLNPTTLVVGKVISLFLVGAVQALVFATPMVAGYVFFRDQMSMPDFDLSHLQFQFWPMLVGALLFVGGFILFTGVLVSIGAVMPTAKDASTVFAPVMIMMFIPFYIVTMVVSDPGNLIVQIFTFFPFTAPITAMLRNGFGSLGGPAAAVVIVELFVFGFAALRLAVHLFRYGSIEYSRKLSLRTAFARKG
ncbi:ABC-2 type transport system permease protein [Arthrobacter silviterrae]|uniref:ABC transporter permease n=1 Tax=Arthrobacter silviterrae TaxID=2026658 RepID=A0ABX0DDJ3_9MICC|nr:ABC transporter permease [Arthrobacter silviterrae]MDQ0277784.1 ABC-2 type transport system permease protein [Arthrobacter silviterrae]NGN83850.1 ABC transporter permease [Arthrobacter silviterrae]